MINADFIAKIEALAKPEILTIEGKNYSSKPLSLVSHDPRPEPLQVSTLTGLAEYINSGLDEIDPKSVIIRVVDYSRVDVISKFSGDSAKRTCYIRAIMDDTLKSFGFNQFIPQEDFIIKVMSLFTETTERADVLKLAGNLKSEAISISEDDGITQTATARAGIAKVAKIEVKNPVRLAPYRTFREIDQPSSVFNFRLQQSGNEKGIFCALFEADGGEWKNDAMRSVKTELQRLLPGYTVIA